jgi:putative aldouronate transport system permease protein
LLALPAILYFVLFHYLPMFGVVLAFKDYKYSEGIFGSDWVGLKNFRFFFTSQDAFRVTRNTVGYGFAFIVIGNIAAISVALLLYEIRNKIALKFYQTSMILPRFLSWVIVGYITYALLNPTMGALNQIMNFFGFQDIDWYANTKYWPFIIIAAETWKHVGLNAIIYYAALMSIDPELFEAARIDGAGRWRQIRTISIPSIVPLVTILAILAIGNLFRGDFGLFYQIPRDVGGLYPATDIIDTYVYRGLRQGDLGITAAVGLFQSAVGLILVTVTNWIVRKTKPENSLF